jgi:alanine-synthesizing transaminase
MSTPTSPRFDDTFADRLEHERTSGRPLLDLTDSDPGRWGLGWDPAELEDLIDESRTAAAREEPSEVLQRARDAVASYLAGRGVSVPPERIQFTPSRAAAYRLLVEAICGPDGEVLVPSPSDLAREVSAAARSGRVGTYALVYDGAWRLDRRALAKAFTRRTRALVFGNPSQPTGAPLSPEDLAFAEGLCAKHGATLVGDEAWADTLQGWASVIEVSRCAGIHLSGLSGVCGLSRIGAEWVAVAGPDALVSTFPGRLEAAVDERVPPPALALVPPLLARRERFLAELRAQPGRNRAALAAASLRESAWSLERGEGGCWAVLRIAGAEDEEALCLRLLEDGVAVRPGSTYGLPREGYLVVSLLPPPAIFMEALARLDRRLRAPLF